MDAIRALIVEDEPLARRRLMRFLQKDTDVALIGECENGREAVEAIHALRPDLVLLDVQMPEMDGMEVLRALDPKEIPAVIFITAYDDYAVRAFDMGVLDYILKPIEKSRFDRALYRAKEHIQHTRIERVTHQLFSMMNGSGLTFDMLSESTKPDGHKYLERLAIKCSGKLSIIKVQNIDWIEGARVYVKLHSGARTHLMRETLNNLESRLDPSIFIRIHRSTIVNVDRIRELVPYFRNEYLVMLHDDTQLKLSRGYRENLDVILGKLV